MTYRFTEDTRETHPELMDRSVTESEVREVYEMDIDKDIEAGGYATFEDWLTDMLKTGLITEEAGGAFSLRHCRAEPSPYPLGDYGQYDFFVERLYPMEDKPGSSRVGPVIYIGHGRDAQTVTGIINGPPSDYRDSLLECAEMRRSLGIRVMEGDDYRPDNLAAERPALEEWTQQKRFLVIMEMRDLGYSFDELESDSSIVGRKRFRDSSGNPESGDIVFGSDEEALRWILDHPDTDNDHIKDLYEQLNPEGLEVELQQRREKYHVAMRDTFRLDEPEPDQSTIFSPIPPRQAGIRR